MHIQKQFFISNYSTQNVNKNLNIKNHDVFNLFYLKLK